MVRRALLTFWCLTMCMHAVNADEIYVTNEKDNSVSVIDGRTLSVVRTLAVGKRPRGITFSRDFAKFFVCASDSNSVQVYDATTGTMLHDLPSGADPEQFALSHDGQRLYIANEDNAVTTVVDVGTRQVVGQIDVGIEPEGMAVSPDDKIAVTTSETTNMVHLIDTATFDVIANVLVDQRPRYAQFTPDGAKLWVSSEIGGTVTIIDVAKREIEKKITFAIPGVARDSIQPVGIRMTRDAKTAFIALGPANRVAVVDVETATPKSYVLVGQRVWHLELSPKEDFLFTTNGVSNDVTVVDTASLRAIKSIKVGRYPWGVAIRATPEHTAGSAPLDSKTPTETR